MRYLNVFTVFTFYFLLYYLATTALPLIHLRTLFKTLRPTCYTIVTTIMTVETLQPCRQTPKRFRSEPVNTEALPIELADDT